MVSSLMSSLHVVGTHVKNPHPHYATAAERLLFKRDALVKRSRWENMQGTDGKANKLKFSPERKSLSFPTLL